LQGALRRSELDKKAHFQGIDQTQPLWYGKVIPRDTKR